MKQEAGALLAGVLLILLATATGCALPNSQATLDVGAPVEKSEWRRGGSIGESKGDPAPYRIHGGVGPATSDEL